MAGPFKPLTIRQILEWADLHFERTGKWPNSRTGVILDQPDRTWESVQTALSKGTCGLPGGSSLYQLLKKRRAAKDPRMVVPDLTLRDVLRWVDYHYERTGQWPHRESGSVAERPQINWATIDRRMRRGLLTLPKGTTLSKWLREVRGVWDGGKPALTERIVLRWAQDHFDRFGRWPVTMSGSLHNHPEENWASIDTALREGRRGFPYRTSLSRFLREHFGEHYDQHIGSPLQKPRRREPIRIKVSH